MTRKWGEHPNDGRGLERISARLKAEQLPSKDVDLPKLMSWLRERHSYLVGLGAKETYEGLIHAHIERLERRLNECGLECSEGLKRLAAENERLRACLAARDVGLAVWAAGAKPKADPGPMGTCCYGGRKLRSDCASCAGWRADQPPGDGQ